MVGCILPDLIDIGLKVRDRLKDRRGGVGAGLHFDANEALSGEGVLAFRTESRHMAGIPQVFGREIRSDTDSGSTHFES